MARYTTTISILIFLFIFLVGNLPEAVSTEAEQTIDEFNLSGFGDKGEKAWEIWGKTADIFSDQIRLNDFVGTIYDEEKITVTAERGDFDRKQDKVHLEENVVITTESGARLTTDYLDWDRASSQVTTEAPVDIKKDNIVTTGVGIKGDTLLQNVDLKRDVKVQIDNKKNKIVITCVGPLSINYADNIAVFNEDVFVDDGVFQMYADLMEVFFQPSALDNSTSYSADRGGSIKKIIARGNVKIIRDGNTSLSQEAVYNSEDKKITLTGRPKLIIYSTEAIDASTGG